MENIALWVVAILAAVSAITAIILVFTVEHDHESNTDIKVEAQPTSTAPPNVSAGTVYASNAVFTDQIEVRGPDNSRNTEQLNTSITPGKVTIGGYDLPTKAPTSSTQILTAGDGTRQTRWVEPEVVSGGNVVGIAGTTSGTNSDLCVYSTTDEKGKTITGNNGFYITSGNILHATAVSTDDINGLNITTMDTSLQGKLDASGGTMTGTLNMGDNSITNMTSISMSTSGSIDNVSTIDSKSGSLTINTGCMISATGELSAPNLTLPITKTTSGNNNVHSLDFTGQIINRIARVEIAGVNFFPGYFTQETPYVIETKNSVAIRGVGHHSQQYPILGMHAHGEGIVTVRAAGQTLAIEKFDGFRLSDQSTSFHSTQAPEDGPGIAFTRNSDYVWMVYHTATSDQLEYYYAPEQPNLPFVHAAVLSTSLVSITRISACVNQDGKMMCVAERTGQVPFIAEASTIGAAMTQVAVPLDLGSSSDYMITSPDGGGTAILTALDGLNVMFWTYNPSISPPWDPKATLSAVGYNLQRYTVTTLENGAVAILGSHSTGIELVLTTTTNHIQQYFIHSQNPTDTNKTGLGLVAIGNKLFGTTTMGDGVNQHQHGFVLDYASGKLRLGVGSETSVGTISGLRWGSRCTYNPIVDVMVSVDNTTNSSATKWYVHDTKNGDCNLRQYDVTITEPKV